MRKTAIILVSIILALAFVACDDKPEHHIVHYSRVEATCQADGNIEYYYCAHCGNFFDGFDGNVIEGMSLADTVIPQTSHEDQNSDGQCDHCHLTLANVSTFTELANSVAAGTKIITFTTDIAWNPSDSHISGGVWAPDMTGIELNLNGHKLTSVPCLAINFTGTNFTIKNGEIQSTGDISGSGALNTNPDNKYKYAFVVNYDTTTEHVSDDVKNSLNYKPASYTDTDSKWASRIRLINITAPSCYIGYRTVEVKGCTFVNTSTTIPRALVLQGSSGIVEDCTLKAKSSAALVAHSGACVELRGTNTFESKFAILASYSGEVTIASGTTTAKGTDKYSLYFEFEAGVITVKNGAKLVLDAPTTDVVFAKETPTSCKFIMEPGSIIHNASGTEITAITVTNPANGMIVDNRGAVGYAITSAAQLASVPSKEKVLYLANDISISAYTSESPLRVNMTGKTLNLCGHKITGVTASISNAKYDYSLETVSCSLVFTGSNFTIKNGTIQMDGSGGGYALVVNAANSSYSYGSDRVTYYGGVRNESYANGAHAQYGTIVFDGIVVPNGGICIYDSKVRLNNCTITQPGAYACLSCMYSQVDVYGGMYTATVPYYYGSYPRWIKLAIAKGIAHNGTKHNDASSHYQYVTNSYFGVDQSSLGTEQPEREN